MSVGVHRASLARDGALDRALAGGELVVARRRARGRPASTSAPRVAARLDEEVVPPVLEHLGQRQVEADVARGPVPIETQKHVPPACQQLSATMNTFARRAA